MKSAYVIMLLILALAGWGSWEARQGNLLAKNLTSVTEQLTASQKAVLDLKAASSRADAAARTLKATLAAAQKEQKIAEQKLAQALKDNPGWASAPIPPGVRSAIEDSGQGNGSPAP